jgi:hypothetical protein
MPTTPVVLTKRAVRWMIVVAVITPILVTGLNVLYTTSVDDRARARTEQSQKRVQQQSDMRWCRLFNLYVDPDQPPPTTERGKQQLAEFLILYNSLGCHKP